MISLISTHARAATPGIAGRRRDDLSELAHLAQLLLAIEHTCRREDLDAHELGRARDVGDRVGREGED